MGVCVGVGRIGVGVGRGVVRIGGVWFGSVGVVCEWRKRWREKGKQENCEEEIKEGEKEEEEEKS